MANPTVRSPLPSHKVSRHLHYPQHANIRIIDFSHWESGAFGHATNRSRQSHNEGFSARHQSTHTPGPSAHPLSHLCRASGRRRCSPRAGSRAPAAAAAWPPGRARAPGHPGHSAPLFRAWPGCRVIVDRRRDLERVERANFSYGHWQAKDDSRVSTRRCMWGPGRRPRRSRRGIMAHQARGAGRHLR